MIYNEEFETMPREALESIQLRRLQATVARVYNATPFYRRRFDEAGVAPADIRSLSDLQKLPFTTKSDLRDNYGTPGELVFTTITKEAFPVIRYRTRDLSVLDPEPCRCGRTIVRMGRIQGRSDDMLIIRGVNVFPSQIESVIMETKHFEPHYQLVVDRIGTLDQLTVLVEVNEAMFSDEIKNLQSIERELERNIRETLGVAAQVKLVEPKGIQRSEGKAVRVIDKRNI
jgi:phenylacetate-coenzyme A ligase PaaK-like adenylate-forming protein